MRRVYYAKIFYFKKAGSIILFGKQKGKTQNRDYLGSTSPIHNKKEMNCIVFFNNSDSTPMILIQFRGSADQFLLLKAQVLLLCIETNHN